MTLFPVPAFSDNYIWVLHDGHRAIAVDPGESEGLLAWLNSNDLRLDTILITHHHGDHTGGVAALRTATEAKVFGPHREAMPEPLVRVGGGEVVEALCLRFEVIDVPGHTAGHIAYCCPDVDGAPLLFCGDTLFSAGCGRLFEGTPVQMLDSLTRLAALPDQARVCCTHEYTLSNLRFALAVDPDNTALQAYSAQCQDLRARNLPTLPSSIGLEKQINPFLRAHVPALERSTRAHDPQTLPGSLGVFTTLRAWKNVFQ
ncbi:hydroxyacylglutathione hydrolase [Hydrogenophaga sp. RWCD_12]|uniref:hydroxyacylglutathione hydrolase n=1 Tax=Hydrogenophaga sp. RWCD_12 TaxID=3391190 RepID=UPI003984C11E